MHRVSEARQNPNVIYLLSPLLLRPPDDALTSSMRPWRRQYHINQEQQVNLR